MIRLLDDHTIVFDMRSLVWGFGESCTIVHGIHSEPEMSFILSNVLYRHFGRSPTALLQFERENFRPPVFGLREASGRGPFDGPPIGSY